MGLDNFLYDRITEEDTYKYTLPEILRMRAEQTPDETAFIFLRDGDDDEERITYKELDHAATAIAHRLIEKDLRGERALMLFPPGLEFVKALYGCFYAGVIAVPAYPPRKNRSLDRIKILVVDSGASIVLTIDNIYQSFERSFSDLEELRKLEWISTDNPASLPPRFPSSPLPLFPVSMPPSLHASMPPHFPMPLDIALLQYTSGSTGQPKGVIETHRNLMRSAEFMRNCFELSRISVSVTWLPCFHDNGLIDGVIVPVYTGFPSVIIPPVTFIQKPICWFKAISKYKATHSGGPNFAFELCAESISEEHRRRDGARHERIDGRPRTPGGVPRRSALSGSRARARYAGCPAYRLAARRLLENLHGRNYPELPWCYRPPHPGPLHGAQRQPPVPTPRPSWRFCSGRATAWRVTPTGPEDCPVGAPSAHRLGPHQLVQRLLQVPDLALDPLREDRVLHDEPELDVALLGGLREVRTGHHQELMVDGDELRMRAHQAVVHPPGPPHGGPAHRPSHLHGCRLPGGRLVVGRGRVEVNPHGQLRPGGRAARAPATAPTSAGS